MTITKYDELFTLPELSFIGGTDKVLTFTAYDDAGALLNLTGATVQWTVCPFGIYNYPVIVKDGVIATVNTFTVSLLAADTQYLAGKYIQQVTINDFSGNTFRPGQGTIIILPAIGVNDGTFVTETTPPTPLVQYISHSQFIWTIEGTNIGAGDTGVKPFKFRIPYVGGGALIEEVYGQLGTAPVSADLHVDILKNGSSILSTPAYLVISTGATTSIRTSGISATPVSKNDYFQIELLQGDNTAADLVIHLRYKWTLTTA